MNAPPTRLWLYACFAQTFLLQPPLEGPRDKDQFNFTDPESRIMKTPDGFGQSYNAQADAGGREPGD